VLVIKMADEEESKEQTFDFTKEDVELFKDIFSLFDKRGDDNIPSAELVTVLRALGENPINAELEEWISKVDPEGKGEIAFSDFLSILDESRKHEDNEDEILESLKVFDTDLSGTIEASELKDILCNMGDKLTSNEVDEFLNEHISNDCVDYNSFVKKVMHEVELDTFTPGSPHKMLTNNYHRRTTGGK